MNVTHIRPPSQHPPRAAMVWLHGLGAEAAHLAEAVMSTGLVESARIEMLFPQAPLRPVTIHQGAVSSAWYDIYALDSLAHEDRSGLQAATQHIHQCISSLLQSGRSPSAIFLCGYSQGGALAQWAALTFPQRLAGLVAISTYLPCLDDLQGHPANSDLPVFLAHGRSDEVLPWSLFERSRSFYQQANFPLTALDYDHDHVLTGSVLADMAQWVQATMTASA